MEADRRHRAGHQERDRRKTIITKEPPTTAKDTTYVAKALEELRAEGVDVDGKGFQPITVELKEGGA